MNDHIDQITLDQLRKLAQAEGIWATITMPTHRTGPETRQDPIRFRNLANDALSELERLDQAAASTEGITERLNQLSRDLNFWQFQTGGLIALVSADQEHLFRLPAAVTPSASAGRWPRLARLVPFVADDTRFRVLAISADSARLLEGTLNSLEESDLGPIPASYDEAFGHIERQKHLQHSAHADRSRFHGHGGGSTPVSNAITRYLRTVAGALDERLRDEPGAPLVLAGTTEVTTEFRKLVNQSDILEKTLSGSHQNTPAHELHQQIWPIVAEAHTLPHDQANARINAAWARDEALLDSAEIIKAAELGRVSDIFLDPNAEADDAVEHALRLTLQMGGAVHALDQPQDRNAAALLRF